MKISAHILKISILMASVFILAGACKSKKKTTDTKANTVKEAPSYQVCDVMVSFISTGEGIDYNAYQDFVKMTAGFMESQQAKLHEEVYNAGREGEKDHCISLVDLSPEVKEEFLMKLEKMADENKLIFVKRDAPNRHME